MEALSPREMGERLRRARTELAITQDKAARALGLRRSAISEIESGKRALRSDELFRFAEFYHREPAWFVVPNAPTVFRVLFRTKGTGPAVRATLLDFERLCRNYAQLEQLFGEPEGSALGRLGGLPRQAPRSKSAVVRLAEAQRRSLGIGMAPARQLADILEERAGVRIFYLRCSKGDFCGASACSPELGPCALVNFNHPRPRRLWTLAHEYYHLLVDARLMQPVGRLDFLGGAREQLPNVFAAEFLVPTSALLDRVEAVCAGKESLTLQDVVHLAEYFGVSNEAMLYRLAGCRVVAWDAATKAAKDKKIRWRQIERDLGYEADDPEKTPGPLPERLRTLPDRYRRLVVKALGSGRISSAKAAEYLGLTVSDVRYLSHQWQEIE